MNAAFGRGAMAAALLLGACSTHTVKTTTYTPAIQASGDVPEELLLDVGIAVFDPGLDDIRGGEEETTNHQVRVAESRYAPYMLADTLQRSGNWGIVRVMPDGAGPMDVRLSGAIVASDGEAMTVRIDASDSTGRRWYTKEYEEVVSQFSYDPAQRRRHDPFQALYNNIANDLLAFRESQVSDRRIAEIRAVSQMLFARRFSQDAFDRYLDRDRSGLHQVTALPADNDPLMARVLDIRERDFLFIDTVQDHYATFARRMRGPYDAWRERAYHETITLRGLKDSARRRFITGTAVILGSLAAAGRAETYAGQVGAAAGVGAGAYLVKSGFDKSNEAAIHVEALVELGQSLENEVAPQVITLDDRTVMLSGSVEEQYGQWRELLADLYAAETGGL